MADELENARRSASARSLHVRWHDGACLAGHGRPLPRDVPTTLGEFGKAFLSDTESQQ